MTLEKTTDASTAMEADDVATLLTDRKFSTVKPKVRDLVAAFDGSAEVAKSPKAADLIILTNKMGKCDPAGGCGSSSQENQLCISPITDRFSADEYFSLGITPPANIFDEASDVASAHSEESPSSQDTLNLHEPRSPSSIYSSDQSYSTFLDTSDDTVVIESKPVVETIIPNYKSSSVIPGSLNDDTNIAPDVNSFPLDDLSQPRFRFADHYQDDDVVIHTKYGCSCRPNLGLSANFRSNDLNIQNRSYSTRTKSIIDGSGVSLVDMGAPGKSHASGSSTSSSSKSTPADTLVGSLGSRSLEKTVSFSSYATPDVGEAANMRNADVDCELNLTRDALRRHVEAKIQELRLATGSVRSYPNPAGRQTWAHPNHLREWNSRNLWCSYCQGICAVCQAPCCAYFGAWKVYKDSSLSIEHRSWAYDLLKELPRWKTVGTDESTFMDCTSCHKLVCPDCCGICPRYPCNDRSCKVCKLDPWEPCDFHHNN